MKITNSKIFFKGDIVEIITATYKSWGDIPECEKGYYINQQEPAPTIGQRFIVDTVINDRIYASINGRLCFGVPQDCVIIVYRSFLNKIRLFLNIK